MESDLGRGRWKNAVGGWVKERERKSEGGWVWGGKRSRSSVHFNAIFLSWLSEVTPFFDGPSNSIFCCASLLISGG